MFLTPQEFNKQLSGIGINRKSIQLLMGGAKVQVGQTLALKTFRRHGTTCSCCGLEAEGYMLRKFVSTSKAKGGVTKHRTRPRVELFGYRVNGTKVPFTTDHIIPKSRGGATTSLSNLQTMCEDCNGKKGNLLPSEEILGRSWFKNFAKDLFQNEPNPYVEAH